jgi:hypothetical protein
LAKFGRAVNYIDKMHAGFKRYLLKLEMTKAPEISGAARGSPTNKLPPPIKRIIE